MAAGYRLVAKGPSSPEPIERTAATPAEALQCFADLGRIVGKQGDVVAYRPNGRMITFTMLVSMVAHGRGNEAIAPMPKRPAKSSSRPSFFAKINGAPGPLKRN